MPLSVHWSVRYSALCTMIALWAPHAFSAPRKLNYIQAHNFRASTMPSQEGWAVPRFSHRFDPKERWIFELVTGLNPDAISAIKDFSTKDLMKLQQSLDASYGRPYDAQTRLGIGYSQGTWDFLLSLNGSGIALVSDPVFPELEALLSLDMTMLGSYNRRWSDRFFQRWILGIGSRQVLDARLTVTDLVAEKPKDLLAKSPWRFFSEASIENRFDVGPLVLFADLQSIPIWQKQYRYWSVEVGGASKNVMQWLNASFFRRWLFGVRASVLRGGDYRLTRTISPGTEIEFISNFWLRAALTDYLPAAALEAKFGAVRMQIFSLGRAYDEYGYYRSRQWGLSVRGEF